MLLQRGDKGAEVSDLQRRLASQGCGVAVDGIFGADTERAVRAFQKRSGLSVDGIAGPRTFAALREPCQLHPNVKAFLDMISHAEGTDRYGDQKGYNVIVGGELFHDYSDHPNKAVWLPAYQIYSTAAGRYQILYRFWVHYKDQLGLPDFGPNSQDRYAIQQIKERRAYDAVIEGRLEESVNRCRNIWASLPGAGYGQREVAMGELADFYMNAGGTIA